MKESFDSAIDLAFIMGTFYGSLWFMLLALLDLAREERKGIAFPLFYVLWGLVCAAAGGFLLHNYLGVSP